MLSLTVSCIRQAIAKRFKYIPPPKTNTETNIILLKFVNSKNKFNPLTSIVRLQININYFDIKVTKLNLGNAIGQWSNHISGDDKWVPFIFVNVNHTVKNTQLGSD